METGTRDSPPSSCHGPASSPDRRTDRGRVRQPRPVGRRPQRSTPTRSRLASSTPSLSTARALSTTSAVATPADGGTLSRVGDDSARPSASAGGDEPGCRPSRARSSRPAAAHPAVARAFGAAGCLYVQGRDQNGAEQVAGVLALVLGRGAVRETLCPVSVSFRPPRRCGGPRRRVHLPRPAGGRRRPPEPGRRTRRSDGYTRRLPIAHKGCCLKDAEANRV